mmetsp:Transcript_7632/g.22572  ORF Transcript_7632/g.22572 Transcript_7632/m.22572 type:complete len:277 (-) Transcript_7632:7846-8676(-)
MHGGPGVGQVHPLPAQRVRWLRWALPGGAHQEAGHKGDVPILPGTRYRLRGHQGWREDGRRAGGGEPCGSNAQCHAEGSRPPWSGGTRRSGTEPAASGAWRGGGGGDGGASAVGVPPLSHQQRHGRGAVQPVRAAQQSGASRQPCSVGSWQGPRDRCKGGQPGEAVQREVPPGYQCRARLRGVSIAGRWRHCQAIQGRHAAGRACPGAQEAGLPHQDHLRCGTVARSGFPQPGQLHHAGPAAGGGNAAGPAPFVAVGGCHHARHREQGTRGQIRSQ